MYRFVAKEQNPGPVTISRNSSEPMTLYKANRPLVAGDIMAGQVVIVNIDTGEVRQEPHHHLYSATRYPL